jgi:cytochrome P450
MKHQSPSVVTETWRLAAPLYAHVMASEDPEYKGYVFPKDTILCADIQGHALMNHGLYPKAGEFHFESWLPQDHSLYNHDLADIGEIALVATGPLSLQA